MGWNTMGTAQRNIKARNEAGDKPKRFRGNSGSFDKNRKNLEAGRATRFKQTVDGPSPGDVFEELTVIRQQRVKQGVCTVRQVIVQCSCGAEPHSVYLHNLLKGASTRCKKCAQKQSGYWRKKYFGYADICPDDATRRRLLGRVSACINRCSNPNDKGYPNYGGRGIKVHPPWAEDRREFLKYLITLDGHDIARLEMDRIDVNKGYEPGNLRFITKAENSKNKRSLKDLEAEIRRLKKDNSDLRHRLRRAEQLLHGLDSARPRNSA